MADSIMAVNTGLFITVNRLRGSGTEPKYLGWGTGTTAPIGTDTGLETASAESRATGASSQVNTDTTGDTYQVVAALTCAGASKTITEVGLFDNAVGGDLFVRGTFSGIALNVNDSIQFTIKTKYARP